MAKLAIRWCKIGSGVRLWQCTSDDKFVSYGRSPIEAVGYWVADWGRKGQVELLNSNTIMHVAKYRKVKVLLERGAK